jgi:hypothetical protein
VIDVREQHRENAFNSMTVNSESVSNEIDESDSQYEKHFKQSKNAFDPKNLNVTINCRCDWSAGDLRRTGVFLEFDNIVFGSNGVTPPCKRDAPRQASRHIVQGVPRRCSISPRASEGQTESTSL